MNKKFWVSGVVGGLILFFWTGLSWMALPWHCQQLKKFHNEQQVASALQQNTAADGLYILPNMCAANADAQSIKDQGFFAFVSVTRQGFRWTSPSPYIISIIIQILGSLIGTYLIAHHALKNFWNAVSRFVLLGLVIGLLGVLPGWNWWNFSLGHIFVEMLDLTIGWFLAGLAISAMYKK